ncbi:sensor histidine kinase [Dactylosporangium siamense]|uniref:histidine kinase n=1 Tax=Dactylosporangium siamense TaxID=685454 RepID=UPI001940995F|nr:histidine kinase [Dactylosporangium siamense]
MSSRRPLAWTLCALAGVEVLVAVAGVAGQRVSLGDLVDSYMLTNTAIGVGFAGCGGILAVQRPANRVGWLLLGAGLAPLTTAAITPVLLLGITHGWPEWTLRLLASVFYAAWPWGICMFLPLALQVFPTGRPVSPPWRWLFRATVAVGVCFTAAMATGPSPLVIADRAVHSYIELPFYDALGPLWFAANLAPLFALLGAIGALVVRYRRGDEQLRRQLLWLVWALIVAVGLNLPRWLVGGGPILLLLAIPLVPVAVTIAILRHQLLDIRLVLSRTVLYLALSLAVIGAYAGLLTLFDALLRGAGAPLLATLLIALAFNPVRVWSQRRVDRLLYGSRSDPVLAVSRVGARLAADDLTGVLDGIRDALRLPFAALRRDGRELAAAGQPPASLHTVPLTFHGARVGELLVGVRSGDRRLAAADHAVLDLLAGPLATALHASALAEEVQASRERIVAAREEERRRLHRDLHDGLGPALTGAGFKADAAHNLVTGAPEQATALLAELRRDIREAIDDVRRLVYGLRPPTLDELGLAGALRRHGATLPLAVTVDAPDTLPALPAAVEVAVYRIGTEALTNVARHANAGAARVELAVDSAVRLSVVDDGSPDGPWIPGVGLTSIRERATELGGTCVAGPTPTGGRVVAVLPLAVPS